MLFRSPVIATLQRQSGSLAGKQSLAFVKCVPILGDGRRIIRMDMRTRKKLKKKIAKKLKKVLAI